MPAVGPLSIDRHDPAFLLVLLLATQTVELDYDAMAKVSEKFEDPRMWTTASVLREDFATLLKLGRKLREEVLFDDGAGDEDLHEDPNSAELNPEHGVWIGQAIRPSSENQQHSFEQRRRRALGRFATTFGDAGLGAVSPLFNGPLDREPDLANRDPLYNADDLGTGLTSTSTHATFSQMGDYDNEIGAEASSVTFGEASERTAAIADNESDAVGSTTPEASDSSSHTEERALLRNALRACRKDSLISSCQIQFCALCLSSHVCYYTTNAEYIDGSNGLHEDTETNISGGVIEEGEENEFGFW